MTRVWHVIAVLVSLPLATMAASAAECSVGNTVVAEVVAIEQPFLLNRFGAYVPGGMLFALRDDVVALDPTKPFGAGNVALRPEKRPRPLVLRVNQGECLEVRFRNLLSPQWREEGTLGENERLPAHTEVSGGRRTTGSVPAGKVSLDLPRTRAASFHVTGLDLSAMKSTDCPVGAVCGGDGMNVGLPDRQGTVFAAATSEDDKRWFRGSLSLPDAHAAGEVDHLVVTRWMAIREGAYFAYSAGATVGGEGDGGQIAQGLFGAVIVEPAGSRWYRSQVTHGDLEKAAGTAVPGRHPYATMNYEQTLDGAIAGREQPVPMLNMLDRGNAVDGMARIAHSDLNAIVVLPEDTPAAGKPAGRNDAAAAPPLARAGSDGDDGGTFGSERYRSFREFTVIFHDEVPVRQAFAALADEGHPLSSLRDNMGINYGVSSMGSLVAATLAHTGPGANCPECRAEEFFLSSWANGDPALVLAFAGDKPSGARFPDDPSNVHHAYLGDPVRFRNVHAGPKETHVFHLHAHQWVMDSDDPNSMYLDSQTISPGATFSYQIEFGGAGNRNYTVGDSIFHCHLYPHFAQGMWELWRVHDTFEDGTLGPQPYDPRAPAGPANDPRWRNLPDAEIHAGTANPAVVPIPGVALAPLPTAALPGYPFYIPGRTGHRPPQPALDMDVLAYPGSGNPTIEPRADAIVNGGLPRHVVVGGTLAPNRSEVIEAALQRGGDAAKVIARRVSRQDSPDHFGALANEWETLALEPLPHAGTEQERRAMAFHEGTLEADGLQPVDATPSGDKTGWFVTGRGYRTDTAATVAGQRPRPGRGLFFVNGQPRAPGAPYANPCPKDAPERDYRAAFIQTELVYNRHGWFDPQGRIIVLEDDIKDIIDPNIRTRLPEPLFFRANSGECIVFRSTNLIPSALNADDFQIITPTDTIGQHIHLVKFDVTSSDGSGNGWNYEDGTFSPEEVRERVLAYNHSPDRRGDKLKLQVHPLFAEGGSITEAAKRATKRNDPEAAALKALHDKGQCPPQTVLESDRDYLQRLNRENPYCGAQRTIQRWWADPILGTTPDGKQRDNTLRTVFTHDHFGPSSHQQHGLYAALVVEPPNSLWVKPGEALTEADRRTLTELPANAPPLGAAALRECLEHERMREASLGVKAAVTAKGARAAKGDGPIDARCKLLGGSSRQAAAPPTDWWAESPPREPLRIRADGGPTGTIANIFVDDAPDRARREFALAFADFGIAYNTALEPINPEPLGDSMLRNADSIRFGRRHVAGTPARPLGISSEDPGSQYVNYRHEPIALRIADATPVGTDKAATELERALGGFRYTQSSLRQDGRPCPKNGLADGIGGLDTVTDCRGDPANALSTSVHANHDKWLATHSVDTLTSGPQRDAMDTPAWRAKLTSVMQSVEHWRRDFNCALYASEAVPGCNKRITHREPWRVFGDPATPILPAYQGEKVLLRLIQGAQEAQHIFTMNGVKWLHMPASTKSGYTNAQPIGISEHFEFDVPVPIGQTFHTDHLYFGSSVDQLWDGLWGVMRSFPHPNLASVKKAPDRARESVLRMVQPLSETPPTIKIDEEAAICTSEGEHYLFEVSAVRACDLYGGTTCDEPVTAKEVEAFCHGVTGSVPDPSRQEFSTGIQYSKRFDIRDNRALVYVLNEARRCGPGDGDDCLTYSTDPNRTVLQTLRQDFLCRGRPLEPLVMRVPAGACMKVMLRNLLPLSLDAPPIKEPSIAANRAPMPIQTGEVPERSAYHNYLPMITDGFNVNQFRMSSSVGLSAPRVAQITNTSDGSNVGRNADKRQGGEQGSLVTPCPPNFADCGVQAGRGRMEYHWSASDFERKGGQAQPKPEDNKPVEFGALPLRSFGDPIQHPMHGLGGALVVGPSGSKPCDDDDIIMKSRPTRADGKPFPGGVSAQICRSDNTRYFDHVLMVQDAVNATRGGMPVDNLSGAEEPDDYGAKALNYRTEPLWARRGNDPGIKFSDRSEFDYADALAGADPETPVLDVPAGVPVRLHLVHPGGHTRQQGIAVAGHNWNPYPWSSESRVLDGGSPSSGLRQGVFNGFGPMMGVTLELQAGGNNAVAKDYLIRSQSSFLFDGGVWGLLRVKAPSEFKR